MAREKCDRCGKERQSMHDKFTVVEIEGEKLCDDCLQDHKKNIDESIIVTTTNSIDGQKIISYIDISSVEIVIGTGAISELTGGLSDIFGERSSGFENKLNEAKKAALSKLKFEAYNAGGNAVIGIDLDYTEFSSNRIGVVANGTIVKTDAIQ